MPKAKANSAARRHVLASRVLKFGRVMPTPCSACRRLKSVCRVDRSSGRCAECIARQRKCDLVVTEADCELAPLFLYR